MTNLWLKTIYALMDKHTNDDTPVHIHEPPCKGCAHWKPIVRQTSYGPSLECCGQEMFKDFSCFEERED